MQSGSHIKVWRGRYYHHGVCVGGNQVVHYKSYGVVMTDLEDFCRSSSPEIVHHPNQDYDQTVQRAYERLGENLYSLTLNNCEAFANWCVTGRSFSHQIEAGADFLCRTFFAEFW